MYKETAKGLQTKGQQNRFVEVLKIMQDLNKRKIQQQQTYSKGIKCAKKGCL